MIEKTDIGDFKGIERRRKSFLKKINIHTVGDLIRYYPHGYDVRSKRCLSVNWKKTRSRQLPVQSTDVCRYPEAAGCR